MNRKELAQELARGTELVVEVASRRLAFREFVAKYDNFYHFNALDGHEASAEMGALLSAFREVCQLHEAVQTKVLDLLYLGDENLEQYVAAGRLLPSDAGDLLREIAHDQKATGLLNQLRQDVG